MNKPTLVKKASTIHMAERNVELMDECFPKHWGMGINGKNKIRQRNRIKVKDEEVSMGRHKVVTEKRNPDSQTIA